MNVNVKVNITKKADAPGWHWMIVMASGEAATELECVEQAEEFFRSHGLAKHQANRPA